MNTISKVRLCAMAPPRGVLTVRVKHVGLPFVGLTATFRADLRAEFDAKIAAAGLEVCGEEEVAR